MAEGEGGRIEEDTEDVAVLDARSYSKSLDHLHARAVNLMVISAN
jgi:hypothetical protein